MIIKYCKCGRKLNLSAIYRKTTKRCRKCHILWLKKYSPAKGNIRPDLVKYNKTHPKKGNKNGMFGKHHTKETKKKISNTETGRKLSAITKKKISKSLRGKNNPMYGKKHTDKTKQTQSLSHGGTGIPYENSLYPAEFNEILRNRIRNRDKNKCKCCGMTKKEHFKKYNRNLEIHHKDHNRNNCKKSNLETRCKKCNIEDNYD